MYMIFIIYHIYHLMNEYKMLIFAYNNARRCMWYSNKTNYFIRFI